MSQRCCARPDFGPRCDPGSWLLWCYDALDKAMWLAQHGTKGLALWLRYPDPSAVLALADRYAWRREWLDELGAPTPLTAEWIETEYAAGREAPF